MVGHTACFLDGVGEAQLRGAEVRGTTEERKNSGNSHRQQHGLPPQYDGVGECPDPRSERPLPLQDSWTEGHRPQ